MTVHVRLFAGMAQKLGRGTLTLELAEASRVHAVQAELLRLHPDLPWRGGTLWAVNQEYARDDSVLHDGDEIGIIPPVSGG